MIKGLLILAFFAASEYYLWYVLPNWLNINSLKILYEKIKWYFLHGIEWRNDGLESKY